MWPQHKAESHYFCAWSQDVVQAGDKRKSLRQAPVRALHALSAPQPRESAMNSPIVQTRKRSLAKIHSKCGTRMCCAGPRASVAESIGRKENPCQVPPEPRLVSGSTTNDRDTSLPPPPSKSSVQGQGSRRPGKAGAPPS